MNDLELSAFQERVAKQRAKFNALAEWHLKLFSESDGVISLPYSGDEQYINCNQYPKDKDGDFNYSGDFDVDATVSYLGTIFKIARKHKLGVKKDYSSDFSLEVVISETPRIVVSYYANREAICTKKVVGTEVVPARVIPETVREVVEWDCAKVALSK